MIDRDDPVILDIGANNGWHTSLFLRHFPNATLHAFEPDPRALRLFRERIDSPRVTPHELALGSEDGEIEFHMSDGHPPDSWGISRRALTWRDPYAGRRARWWSGLGWNFGAASGSNR
jgi:FkbM family methyltransferase